MLQDYTQIVIDSFVAPRKAARRIIDSVSDFSGVGVIFGLSFTLNAIILILTTNVAPEAAGADPGGGIFSLVVVNLIFSAVMFVVLSGIILGVGKMFGGKGSPVEVMAALAWHSLITVVFAPFLSFEALMSGHGGGFAVQAVMMMFTFWLLINFVAEAHRFASVWKVAGTMFGMLFFVALLMSLAGMNAT